MSDELKLFMTEFCKAGADAIVSYATASGMPVSTMPEYFLGSSLLTSLCSKRAVTLETKLKELHQWASNSGVAPSLTREVQNWKLDMIFYDGGGGKPPSEQKVFALVELKNGYIDADILPNRRSDRAKLLPVIEWFTETRPHIILAGALNAERREYHHKRACELGDAWAEHHTGSLPYELGEMWFCARVIAGEADT